MPVRVLLVVKEEKTVYTVQLIHARLYSEGGTHPELLTVWFNFHTFIVKHFFMCLYYFSVLWMLSCLLDFFLFDVCLPAV